MSGIQVMQKTNLGEAICNHKNDRKGLGGYEKEYFQNFLEREILYFRETVVLYKGQEEWICGFEDCLSKILNEWDAEEAKVDELWNQFERYKAEFYTILIDEVFIPLIEGKAKKDFPAGKSMMNALKALTKRALSDPYIASYTGTDRNTNRRRSVCLDENGKKDIFSCLWMFLGEFVCPDEKDPSYKVHRIQTFNREKGCLLFTKIGGKYSWIKSLVNRELRKNFDRLCTVSIEEIEEKEDIRFKGLIQEAKSGVRKVRFSPDQLMAVRDVVIDVLRASNTKQFEVWVLRFGGGISLMDCKWILACLSQDSEWKEGRTVSEYGKEKLWVNLAILDWNPSNITEKAQAASGNVCKINGLLIDYLERSPYAQEYEEMICFLKKNSKPLRVDTQSVLAKKFQECVQSKRWKEILARLCSEEATEEEVVEDVEVIKNHFYELETEERPEGVRPIRAINQIPTLTEKTLINLKYK